MHLLPAATLSNIFDIRTWAVAQGDFVL